MQTLQIKSNSRTSQSYINILYCAKFDKEPQISLSPNSIDNSNLHLLLFNIQFEKKRKKWLKNKNPRHYSHLANITSHHHHQQSCPPSWSCHHNFIILPHHYIKLIEIQSNPTSSTLRPLFHLHPCWYILPHHHQPSTQNISNATNSTSQTSRASLVLENG